MRIGKGNAGQFVVLFTIQDIERLRLQDIHIGTDTFIIKQSTAALEKDVLIIHESIAGIVGGDGGGAFNKSRDRGRTVHGEKEVYRMTFGKPQMPKSLFDDFSPFALIEVAFIIGTNCLRVKLPPVEKRRLPRIIDRTPKAKRDAAALPTPFDIAAAVERLNLEKDKVEGLAFSLDVDGYLRAMIVQTFGR